jgi:hypothetical protein
MAMTQGSIEHFDSGQSNTKCHSTFPLTLVGEGTSKNEMELCQLFAALGYIPSLSFFFPLNPD